MGGDPLREEGSGGRDGIGGTEGVDCVAPPVSDEDATDPTEPPRVCPDI